MVINSLAGEEFCLRVVGLASHVFTVVVQELDGFGLTTLGQVLGPLVLLEIVVRECHCMFGTLFLANLP